MPVFRNSPGLRDRFRAASRDAHLRTVAAAESRGRPSRHVAWKLLWLAPLAAAAALLLVRPTGFGSQGEERAEAPRFELVCADAVGSAVHCTRSERLYFWFPGATDHVFLSAYAEPVAGGERVWFFPTASTPEVELAKGSGPKAAPNASSRSPSGLRRAHFCVRFADRGLKYIPRQPRRDRKLAQTRR